ncbi:MAG: CHAP domain-containing protein [Conexibacter sp.]
MTTPAERRRRARPRRAARILPLSLLALALAAPAAVATPRNAGFIELGHNTSGGDNRLDVTLTVTTGVPYADCTGTLRLRTRGRHLLALTTGSRGGGRWRWQVAPGAPAGTLRVAVTCVVDHRKVHKATSFEVQAGPDPSAPFRRIDAVGSMVAGPWTPPDTEDGSGGGGASLYPPGQCTRFVAALRPDLPFFANAAGDAGNWARSAAQAGWIVDQQPAPGAVAVFSPGQYGAGYMGHVAYVTAVLGDRIEIRDQNWKGDGRKLQRTTKWRGLDFIHDRTPDQRIIDRVVDPPPTVPETTGGIANTWTDYVNAGGLGGPQIPGLTTVQIACKVTGFRVTDGNTWWYRIASAPWNDAYYVSADAFYNNGQTSGSLRGTPFVDSAVPDC